MYERKSSRKLVEPILQAEAEPLPEIIEVDAIVEPADTDDAFIVELDETHVLVSSGPPS